MEQRKKGQGGNGQTGRAVQLADFRFGSVFGPVWKKIQNF